MRNPHAGEPFDYVRRGHRRGPDGRQHPDADALARPHVRRPRAHSRPAEAGRALPQRGPGLHERGGQGRGRGPSPSRSSATTATAGCPEPEPVSAELLHEMMSLAGLRGGAGRVRPDAHGGDGARRELTPDASRVPADAAAREAFPVVVIGCGQSGLLAGIRLKEAGIPFTIVEKNAGRRWDLVGELLPRGTGRRRQPLLLLQLRAERRMDGVLRTAAGAPGLLRGGDDTSTASSRTSGGRPRSSGPQWDEDRRHVVGPGPGTRTAPSRH